MGVQQNDHRLLWAWHLLPAKPDTIRTHDHLKISRIFRWGSYAIFVQSLRTCESLRSRWAIANVIGFAERQIPFLACLTVVDSRPIRYLAYTGSEVHKHPCTAKSALRDFESLQRTADMTINLRTNFHLETPYWKVCKGNRHGGYSSREYILEITSNG